MSKIARAGDLIEIKSSGALHQIKSITLTGAAIIGDHRDGRFFSSLSLSPWHAWLIDSEGGKHRIRRFA